MAGQREEDLFNFSSRALFAATPASTRLSERRTRASACPATVRTGGAVGSRLDGVARIPGKVSPVDSSDSVGGLGSAGHSSPLPTSSRASVPQRIARWLHAPFGACARGAPASQLVRRRYKIPMTLGSEKDSARHAATPLKELVTLTHIAVRRQIMNWHPLQVACPSGPTPKWQAVLSARAGVVSFSDAGSSGGQGRKRHT